MTNLMGFMSMEGNYAERVVANYTDTKSGLEVDTAAVTDSVQPFETGIKHPEYNDGSWIIVEMYNSKEDAQAGHHKWIKLMTTSPLPDELVDAGSSEARQLADGFSEDEWRYKRKAEDTNG